MWTQLDADEWFAMTLEQKRRHYVSVHDDSQTDQRVIDMLGANGLTTLHVGAHSDEVA